MRARVLAALGTIGGMALLAAACGDSSDRGTTAGDEAGDTEASPFLVDAVPDGFRPEVAGRGGYVQEWGEDSTGTQEPFTVLVPSGGDPSGDEAVIVSVTGFEGYEGGLDQASPGWLSESTESFTVDGDPARFSPAGSDGGDERGDDLAVRVTAVGYGREELVDIDRRIVPDEDRTRAPQVPDPPGGLEVVGSVDAGVEVALSPHVTLDRDYVPALDVGYGAGWVTADARPEPGLVVTVPADAPPGALPAPSTSLSLVAYPGRTADLDAVAGFLRFRWTQNTTVEPATVSGRPAVVVEAGDEEFLSRTVLTHATWGDLLMAGASGAPAAVPSVDQLTAVLASAREVTPEEWDAFVTQAAGGPGLHPDEGAVELERGTTTGGDGVIEWLLQAWPGRLDPCLKLPDGDRTCASGVEVSTGVTLGHSADVGVPPFVIATVDHEAARLRVTTDTGSAEGVLHPVPGSALWGGVAFVDGAGAALAACPGDPDPAGTPTMMVELLDASGARVGCLDSAGQITD